VPGTFRRCFDNASISINRSSTDPGGHRLLNLGVKCRRFKSCQPDQKSRSDLRRSGATGGRCRSLWDQFGTTLEATLQISVLLSDSDRHCAGLMYERAALLTSAFAIRIQLTSAGSDEIWRSVATFRKLRVLRVAL
jgi:hypothetical protein